MPELFLPQSFVNGLAEEYRRGFEADVLASVTVEDPVCDDFTRRLQRVDPDLFMVRARAHVRPGTPLWPGHYHVLKRNLGAPMSVFHVHDGHDGFVVPTERVFEMLAAGDLRDPRTLRQWAEDQRRAEQAVERDRVLETEDRRTELRERVNAAVRTQVSLDRSIPWTQNASGRRPQG